jgi:hypothetical protein
LPALYRQAAAPINRPLPRVRAVWGDQPEASAAKPLARIRFSDRPAPSQGSSYDRLSRSCAPDPAADPAPRPAHAPIKSPRPARRLNYIDVVAGWFRQPRDQATLDWLDSECGGKLGHKNRKPRFRRNADPEREYLQQLTLRQPSNAALEYLAKQNDWLQNYVELSHDQIFEDQGELDAAFLFALEHSVKKDRRGQSATVYLGKNGPAFYSDARWSSNNLVLYADKPSKSGKQPYCLHADWRMGGVKALKRLDLDTPARLLKLDYAAFWRDRLQLWHISDIEGLGRAYANWQAKQENPQSYLPRRSPHIIKLGKHATMNVDKRLGHLILRSAGLFADEQLHPKLSREEMERLPGFMLILQARALQNVIDIFGRHLHPISRFISMTGEQGFHAMCPPKQQGPAREQELT